MSLATAPMVPLCEPALGGREWEYVKECLDTRWVSSVGAYVDRFEAEFAAAVGAPYAIATVNGTAALHVALLVAGVQPDDEVLIPALTFIAPANAIRYVGAWPVFVDVEPAFYQMDVGCVEEFLATRCIERDGGLRNRQSGRRIGGILPVHLLGHPVDLAPLRALGRRFNLPIVEDATESLGAQYRGQPLGSDSEIACFSFNGNKLITTGGGGMIVSHRPDWAAYARYLCTQAKDDPIEYIHHEVGYNYRLTNLQAALGVAQLEQLGAHLAAKRRIAALYRQGLAQVPGLTLMAEAPWARSTFWMYTVRIQADGFGLGSREVLSDLANAGIQCRPLWQPLHRSPAHRSSAGARCPVAEQVQQEALSLPCSVGLSEPQQQRVIQQLRALARH
ncbi:MAG TPA: LegC family aminotransferase [Gemmatimonadales bacterium]|nr:LegC family aminotransferase [Gemmatimonadales bacterium]